MLREQCKSWTGMTSVAVYFPLIFFQPDNEQRLQEAIATVQKWHADMEAEGALPPCSSPAGLRRTGCRGRAEASAARAWPGVQPGMSACAEAEVTTRPALHVQCRSSAPPAASSRALAAGYCRLDMAVLSEVIKQHDLWAYPYNALRNQAVSRAQTEARAPLSQPFVSLGSARHIGAAGRCAAARLLPASPEQRQAAEPIERPRTVPWQLGLCAWLAVRQHPAEAGVQGAAPQDKLSEPAVLLLYARRGCPPCAAAGPALFGPDATLGRRSSCCWTPTLSSARACTSA